MTRSSRLDARSEDRQDPGVLARQHAGRDRVTAAVLTAAIADASRIAVGTPVSPSNRTTTPWWASSPRAGLPGITATALSEKTGSEPPRQAGIHAKQPGRSLRHQLRARRHVSLAAGQRHEHVCHRLSALERRQQLQHVLVVEDEDLAHASALSKSSSGGVSSRRSSASRTGSRCSGVLRWSC